MSDFTRRAMMLRWGRWQSCNPPKLIASSHRDECPVKEFATHVSIIDDGLRGW